MYKLQDCIVTPRLTL